MTLETIAPLSDDLSVSLPSPWQPDQAANLLSTPVLHHAGT